MNVSLEDTERVMIMKKVIAAKVEQIFFFDTEENSKAYCDEMQRKDPNFELLDYDNTPTDEFPDGYTIRIIKSYNNNTIIKSDFSIYNDVFTGRKDGDKYE